MVLPIEFLVSVESSGGNDSSLNGNVGQCQCQWQWLQWTSDCSCSRPILARKKRQPEWPEQVSTSIQWTQSTIYMFRIVFETSMYAET